LEIKTWSKVRSRVDDTTETFNLDVETKLKTGLIGVIEVVEQVLQNKLSTVIVMIVLTEERQRVTTREVMRGPHRDKEQRDRLRDITTLQIALTVLRRPPG
jgi:hypothetical protein